MENNFYEKIKVLYQEIKIKLNGLPSDQFYASDWDNKVLKKAKANFQQTNLDKVINLKKQNAINLMPPIKKQEGVMFVNIKKKTPNYKTLSDNEKELLDKQLDIMIGSL